MSDGAKHARLSASGAERWMKCPGSVHLSQFVENEDSEYSKEGTAAHALAALLLENGEDAWMHDTIDGYDVVDDMALAVQEYVDYVREASEGSDLRIEMPLNNPEFGDDFGGTADAVVNGVTKQRGGFVHIIDYKHGAGIPVDVEGNLQLRYYAFGVLKGLGLTRDDAVNVGITIVQPRCSHPSGAVREEWTDVADIITWGEDELLPAMERVDKEKDSFDHGEHCRFCPAKLICPRMREIEEEFMDTDAGTLKGLTDDDLSERYEHVAALRMLIKAVEDECRARALKGSPVPGTKLIYGRSTRDWKDEASQVAIAEQFGEDAMTDPKLKSPAQIEKLPGGKDATALHSYKKEGAPTLVPSDKKGLEFVPEKAGAVFASIDAS